MKKQQMMKENKNSQKGITLIALVVTIIVLIILAGVSIDMLVGDNGIITQANLAKKLTEVGSEKEAVQLIMTMHYMDEENEKYDIGKQLYSRNLTNGDKWNVVIIKDTDVSYGDDCIYISKGTGLLDYGEAKYGWIYNEKTGETIQLEEGSFVELAYGSNLAVTEGLVFNLDPLNMEDSDSWGDAQLHGFSGTETDEEGNVVSGFSGTDFNFDGVDDCIEINSTADFSNDGITIEIYGSILADNSSYLGAIYKGPREGAQEAFKFGIGNGSCDCMQGNYKYILSGTFYQGIPTGTKYQCQSYVNDFHIPLKNEVYGGESYVTFSLKDDGSFYVLSVGEKIAEDKFNADYVENYKTYLANTEYPIIIGANTWADDIYFQKMKAYAIRIYNKALTEEEAIENYEKTVASRVILGDE